jgi:hypothetical protein
MKAYLFLLVVTFGLCDLTPGAATAAGGIDGARSDSVGAHVSGDLKTPAGPGEKPNPGSVTTGKSFVLYDASIDAGSGCSPYLDAPIYPISFPSTNHQEFELWFSVVSPANDGNNYWIKGNMNSAGAETSPLRVNCSPILTSPHDPDSRKYSGSEWLTGFYKQPDGSIYSIVHNEYYGGNFPHGFNFLVPSSPQCNLGSVDDKPVNPLGCTYTSLTMAVMASGTSSFKPVANPPSHIVARPALEFIPNAGKATGYFTNTNILKNSDGYYYAMTVDVLPDGSERRCPIRTSDLSKPSVWRGWGGSDFTMDIAKGADCANTGFSMFPFYLGYNTFFKKFIMLGASAGHIAYALSSDLVHWSQPVSFGVPIFDPQSADWSNNNYPSLLDPSALQQTQDGNASSGAVSGQKAWLVFIQHKKPQNTRALAIPVGFSK